jgi:endogenous inhibitor of DNA gyrase (YacG/DUF329 family)
MKCPICKKPVTEAPPAGGKSGPFPFCSERCQLIDLGRWLDGKYQVPVIDDDEAHDGVVDQPQPPRSKRKRG